MDPRIIKDSPNSDQQNQVLEDEGQAKILKTGFQAKYLDPIHRRIFLDRQGQILETGNSPQALAAKETPNEIQNQDNQKLDNLVEMCEKPILQVKTVFPFVLFTNEVIIDIHKVSIVYGIFLLLNKFIVF